MGNLVGQEISAASCPIVPSPRKDSARDGGLRMGEMEWECNWARLAGTIPQGKNHGMFTVITEYLLVNNVE
jgi:hypothetical protein